MFLSLHMVDKVFEFDSIENATMIVVKQHELGEEIRNVVADFDQCYYSNPLFGGQLMSSPLTPGDEDMAALHASFTQHLAWVTRGEWEREGSRAVLRRFTL